MWGCPVAEPSRRCAQPGCRAWARRGGTLCSSHERQAARRAAPQTASSALDEFYAGLLTPEEKAEIARLMQGGARYTGGEVAVMRVLIRRVMERNGQDDPLKALPAIREGVDGICRALRTEHVLSGEAGETLLRAFARVLEEMGEELGLGQ